MPTICYSFLLSMKNKLDIEKYLVYPSVVERIFQKVFYPTFILKLRLHRELVSLYTKLLHKRK